MDLQGENGEILTGVYPFFFGLLAQLGRLL